VNGLPLRHPGIHQSVSEQAYGTCANLPEIIMGDDKEASARQQELYLSEVLQLMIARDYMRRYRGILARSVTWFGALRALASCSAIAAWAVWQSHPMIWGGIIAGSQVADALKDVFPFSARHQAANELATSLEALLIEPLYEAESVCAGQLAPHEITLRRRQLMKLRHDAELRHFPSGSLPERKRLFALAERSSLIYYASMFESRVNP
jgi:hypothetical protein